MDRPARPAGAPGGRTAGAAASRGAERIARIPVSVVIPVYNARDVLPRALGSITAQRLAPAEVVLVDDGSTDGGPVWPHDTRAAGIAVRWERAAHGGPSRARNRGIQLAHYPWVAFLDADDAWEPDKLLLQWEVVCAGPEDLVLITSDWLRPGQRRRQRGRTSPRIFRDGARRLLWMNRFQTSTVLARRDAILRGGGFRPEFDGVEDWDLWLRLAALGRWAHLPLPLVRYADSPGGVSKDLERVYRSGLMMLERYPAGQKGRVVLWHHLRFALAFAREGHDDRARRCLQAAWRPGTRWAAMGVAVTAVLPFLLGRLRRRIPLPAW